MLSATASTRTFRRWLLCLTLGAAVLAGCSNMEEQPKLETYGDSPSFGTSARQPVPEAVPVGYSYEDTALYLGTVDGELVSEFPVEITEALMTRGQNLYNDFCSPCHGYAGYGDGVVAQEGYPPPASFHTDYLRGQPVGHIFNVITNGTNIMYSYASRIEPADRWAVVAYVRALQLSQYAAYDQLPPELQAEVGG